MSDHRAPAESIGNSASRSPVAVPPEDRFRGVLAHFPTAVVVVAGNTTSGPAGLAVGSFTSISLVPQLVGFFVASSSTSWPLVRTAPRFCVNLLAEDQVDLCRAFARSGGDKFASFGWASSPAGAPMLNGVVAWVDCAMEREVTLGDHVLVVGSVLGLDVVRDCPPLVFHRGEFPGLSVPDIGR